MPSVPRLMSLLVLIIVVMAIAVPPGGVAARFLQPSEIQADICWSRTSSNVVQMTVVDPPSTPQDIIVFPPMEKMVVTCVHVVEIGPDLLPTQMDLCRNPPTLRLCTAVPSAVNPNLIEWNCVPVPQWHSAPGYEITLGRFKGGLQQHKIDWMPNNMGVACFPRDITAVVTYHEISPVSSNTTAVVIFIIIACAVALLVCFVATYQLRKQFSKFWKRSVMSARQGTDLTVEDKVNIALGGGGRNKRGEGGGNTNNAAYSPGGGGGAAAASHHHLVNVYGEENIVPTRGVQETVVEGTDGAIAGTGVSTPAVAFRSAPMIKPWYHRHEYDVRKQQQQQQEKERQGAEEQQRQQRQGGINALPPASPEAIDRSATGGGGGRQQRQLSFSSRSPTRGGGAGGTHAQDDYYDVYGERYPQSQQQGYYGDQQQQQQESSGQLARGGGGLTSMPSINHDPRPVGSGVFHQQQYLQQQVFQGQEGGSELPQEDEMVLTCGDCMLPIRGDQTPKHCAVTGKRHY